MSEADTDFIADLCGSNLPSTLNLPIGSSGTSSLDDIPDDEDILDADAGDLLPSQRLFGQNW